jgi:uncharacterized protein (UPF0335 family)
MDWRGRIAVLEAERDALLSKLAEAGIALADCGTALIAAEAERDALRAEVKRREEECWAGAEEVVRLRADGTIASLAVAIARAERAEAERDALRSTVHDLSVQLEESGKEERALREIMRRLVAGIDNWNASVEPIIGRPVDYKWLALEEARDVLAPEGKP